MSIVLTYWEIPKYGQNTPDDFDGILEIRLKSVKQIPNLIAHMPPHCAMISTEHSAERTLKSGRKTNFFKEIWRKGQPLPTVKSEKCPLCGHKREN